MTPRRLVAWVLLLLSALVVLGWVVVVNVAYAKDGFNLGSHDIQFWPGGAAIATDTVVLGLVAIPLVILTVRAIAWAWDEVTA